jgi:hypothetical protein
LNGERKQNVECSENLKSLKVKFKFKEKQEVKIGLIRVNNLEKSYIDKECMKINESLKDTMKRENSI